MGRIFAADTIAVSSPAFTHSCRNTEFSTCRAAALRPNDTFEMPSVVCTPECRRLSSRIASIVSSASRRTSSCPVVIGKVRVSTTMSSTCMPWFAVRSRISRSAIRTFQSAVRAWPSSSMHSATTAAPCSRTSAIVRWKREPGPSPSS
jgi:hypothetical protein